MNVPYGVLVVPLLPPEETFQKTFLKCLREPLSQPSKGPWVLQFHDGLEHGIRGPDSFLEAHESNPLT